MLDIKAIAADPDRFKQNLKNRGSSGDEIDAVLATNEERKKLIGKTETLKAEQNKKNQDIAKMKKAGEDASQSLADMKALAQEIKAMAPQLSEVEDNLKDQLLRIPNLCHETTPVGKSEEDNQETKAWGKPPEFSFKPLEHWELGEKLGILDFERASQVAGARFAFLRSDGARLERALANFMLDQHTQENGYEEVNPPLMVNKDAATGTGNLPKFEEDLFHLKEHGYYLIPTAEVPVTNFYRQEVVKESLLPKGFTAYTPCFRSEAGSYGKDTKGLIRQHQFTKVEVVRFCKPEDSYDQLELLTRHAEGILQKLGLHYRVMVLCTGDTSFGSAKTYDLEVWLPGQNAYREISSCTNFESFQARRANIRFKPDGGGKPEYVHTINGSGLAIGRTIVALLENYQQEDGSVIIPEVLQPYTGFDKIPSK